MKFSSWPLWLKILIAALSVQTLVLLALGYATVTSLNQTLLQQNQTRLTELRTLLNANIATALFQRDLANIQLLFTRIQHDDSIAYLRLVDDTGQLVATAGTPIKGAIHHTLDIRIDHLTLGKLDFDLSTTDTRRAQQALMWRSFLVAGVTITIAFILLLLLSVWLTRRLRQLTVASELLSTGNPYIKLPDTSNDEVGKLNTAFNSMANSLQQRISDLHTMHTQQKDNLQLAHAEQARLTALLAAMNLGILFVDNHGEVLYYNPAFNDIWQPNDPDQIKGQLAITVLSKTHVAVSNPAAFSDHIARISKPGGGNVLEISMADGRIVTHTIRTIHSNDGEVIGSLWIFEDITHERLTAAQLIYLAERDALTGLYNRHSFESALQTVFQEHERNAQTGALLFIDLDGFKYVNDSFGHYAGDETLIRIAGVMSALVRAGEVLYRLGGDEFAILLNSASQTDAQTLASRVVQAIAQTPFQFGGQDIRITSSIGIALFPLHAQDGEMLVARADAAMYQAKLAGKNNWRAYQIEQDSSREMILAMHWNRRIDLALQTELFVPYLQGVYETNTRTLSHYEVLIRMRETPDTPLIPPAQFIPIAEQSGQILAIDRWVLTQSVKILTSHPDIPALAVNLSGRSLDDITLIDFIAKLLAHYQLDHTRLMFEITETAALSDLRDAQRTIQALRLMGCSVSLDDFGTGFASFAYLKYLDADILKIDGLFVRNICDEPDNRIFIQAIVDVAHGLGKKTVAECVETVEIYDILKQLGVDMVQGYYLHRPSPIV